MSCACGHYVEDPFHYFLGCPRYNAPRNKLLVGVAQHSVVTVGILLYGEPSISDSDNCKIFDAVQRYIIESNRFN